MLLTSCIHCPAGELITRVREAIYKLHQPDVVHLKNHLVLDRNLPRAQVELLFTRRGGRYLWSHTAVRRSTRQPCEIKAALEETRQWLLQVASGDPSFLEDQVSSVFSSLAALVDRGELTGALQQVDRCS